MNRTHPAQALVIDLLEQIKNLDPLIQLHEENGDASSLKQYLFLKDEFINKLDQIIKEQNINIQDIPSPYCETFRTLYPKHLIEKETLETDVLSIENIKSELTNIDRQAVLGASILFLLLLNWVLLEAASKHLLEKDNYKTTKSLIPFLLDKKIITLQEKKWLLLKKKTRDLISHGLIYKGDAVKVQDIKKISSITRKILKKVSKSA